MLNGVVIKRPGKNSKLIERLYNSFFLRSAAEIIKQQQPTDIVEADLYTFRNISIIYASIYTQYKDFKIYKIECVNKRDIVTNEILPDGAVILTPSLIYHKDSNYRTVLDVRERYSNSTRIVDGNKNYSYPIMRSLLDIMIFSSNRNIQQATLSAIEDVLESLDSRGLL